MELHDQPQAPGIRAVITGRVLSSLSSIFLLLTGCSSGTKEIFSSRTSPDGSKIAENIFTDLGGGEGHLVVLNAQTNHVNDLLLREPAPDLFMRWLDNNHLEIWREGKLSNPAIPDLIGNVHVVRKSYEPPFNSVDTYRRPELPIKTVTVPENNVLGRFSQYSDNVHFRDAAHFCVLSIGTRPDLSYDMAKVEITVGINMDRKPRPSAGVQTEFTLGSELEPDRQIMLTSATISDIPSYNRLPKGGQGTTVRGQFLERNAAALIEQLKKTAIQIEYSRNFFEQVLKYDMPLAGAAEALERFYACVGNADFLWAEHDHPR